MITTITTNTNFYSKNYYYFNITKTVCSCFNIRSCTSVHMTFDN
jgi:hypothetical protein